MSAYAALQQGSIFDDEDIVIKYDQNSSDDEGDQVPETSGAADVPVADIPSNRQTFVQTPENVICRENHIIVGLKANESVSVTGQFRVVIQRGAVTFNGVHYYHAPQEFVIIQPNFVSSPVIASTQVTNTEAVKAIQTDDNSHMFSSDYKSVVQLVNLATGLEDIATYYPPFKNVFTQPPERTLSIASTGKEYTFEVQNTVGDRVVFEGETVQKLDEITQTDEVSVFMTIGNKNSGKSTISKVLINTLVEHGDVSVLDLDPGQSEYSKPYCLSITTHQRPIFGINHHRDHEQDVHYYYGFTTPQSNPELYTEIVRSLVSYYNAVLRHRGNHLVVNTPGWVKGYGKELLVEITKLVNPDQLILLTGNVLETDDIVAGLTFKNLCLCKGSFIQSRYSAAEIRNFNKLAYFHQKQVSYHDPSYDFKEHILNSPPFKVSYQTNEDFSFVGVNFACVVNYDAGLHFDIADLDIMLDSSIVGLYLIHPEHFEVHKHLVDKFKGLVPYMNSSHYNHMIEYNNENVRFFGLAMIHSINTIEKYFSMYISQSENVSKLQKLMEEGFKLLVVKGESDIPTCEVLNRDILQSFKKRYKQSFKAKEPLPSLPYVSYNGKINGTWRIRRNVMRRGQQ